MSILFIGCAQADFGSDEAAMSPKSEVATLGDFEARTAEEEWADEDDGAPAAASQAAFRSRGAVKQQKTIGGSPARPAKNTAAFPGKPALPRFDIAGERLLEYNVTLAFKTDELVKSRHDLYAIIARHGFLTRSATDAGERLHVGTQFRVRASDLYKVIDELKVVGQLESESISVTDHTEPMAWQARKARREAVRSVRRSKAPATAKTWAQKEQLISASEDRRDEAEHEKWKINDRVQWANFSVQLIGPEAPAEIEVPRFANAFTGMINLLLDVLYGLIYLSPLWLLAALLIWGLRKWRARRAKAANA